MPEKDLTLPRNPSFYIVAPPTTTTGDLFYDNSRSPRTEPAFGFYDRKGGPKLPTLGTPAVTAILNECGFGYRSADYRFSDITQDLDLMKDSNALLITAITVNSGPAKRIIEEYRARNPKGVVIMGGPHATALPGEMLQNGVDLVVGHEGEVIGDLVRELQKKDGSPGNIPGVSYLEDGSMVTTKRPPLLTSEELSQLPHPIYPPGVLEKGTVYMMNTSRGCPYGCEFCGVTEFFGKSYRRFDNDWAIDELKIIKRLNDRRVQNGKNQLMLFIDDDNFYAGNESQRRQALDLLDEATEDELIPPGSLIQLRVDAARDEKLLSALSRSNIGGVCLGIESMNDAALASVKKHTTSESTEACVQAYRKAGMWIHGMFILGIDGDTKTTVRQTVDWAKHHVHSAQFFAPVPLPGTKMTAKMEQSGRVLSREYSLYDGSHVVIDPENMSPAELQAEVDAAHREFYAAPRFGRLVMQDVLRNGHNGRSNLKLKLKLDLGLRLDQLLNHGGQARSEATNWYNEQLKTYQPGQLISFPK